MKFGKYTCERVVATAASDRTVLYICASKESADRAHARIIQLIAEWGCLVITTRIDETSIKLERGIEVEGD